MTIYDTPMAVLIGLNGYQRAYALSSVPPPPVIEIAIRERLFVNAPDADASQYRPVPRRTFRLSRQCVSRTYRWWHVYNEGRSRTPEDGFVYFEVPIASSVTPER